MQSQRREDYVRLSPTSKSRAQNRLERDRDEYRYSRHETVDHSSRLRRSMSPQRLDGSRRGVDQRTSAMERRDHNWYMGGGGKDHGQSRSPSFGQVRKRPHLDEGVVQRDYRQLPELQQGHVHELSEPMDYFIDDESSYRKHVYRYEHIDSRITKERGVTERGFSPRSVHRMVNPKSMTEENIALTRSYELPMDMRPISNYGETSVPLPSSRTLDKLTVEHERLLYRDTVPLEKLPVVKSHKDQEQQVFDSKEAAYPIVSGFDSKEFSNSSQMKDFASSSSGLSRSKFVGSYQDGQHLAPLYEFSRSRDTEEAVGFNEYGPRPHVNAVREPETGKKSLACYQRGAHSPRSEREAYFYSKQQGTINNRHGYQPGSKMIHSSGQGDYNPELVEPDYGEMRRPRNMNTVVERLVNTDGSHANIRERLILDHPLSDVQKQNVSDYFDMSKATKAIRKDGRYVDSEYAHIEVGGRVPRDHEASHFDASRYSQNSQIRSEYGYGREENPQYLKEDFHSSPSSIYDSDMRRNAERMQRTEGHLVTYRQEGRNVVLSTKYGNVEGRSAANLRTNLSSKYCSPRDFQDLYDSDEEWVDDDISGLYASKAARFDHREYKKSKRTYDHHEGFDSDNLLQSQGYIRNAKRHSVGSSKHGSRFIRGHTRRGSSLSWHNTPHLDRRINLRKQHKVWKRNEDYNEHVHGDDDDLSEDWMGPAESEPYEDSEEFKQLVHEAFLIYSKKVNIKHGNRRRYKEQGKAGGLYCIVCGKSYSKEFMDTQRLVTHAFMSHNAGLRARHLGLHKAICVLLGWNTTIPRNIVTWVPDILPKDEALAQKEDLILWPPLVVVRNISLTDNNPDKWKVVAIEAFETFLRTKGFSSRGRVKVSLGMPADQSVMVVKFLGTFSGLEEAEKLNKYFAENKHGRVDFEQNKSNSGKTSNSLGVGIKGDNIEEQILYGYMGIAEDFDEVDFNTKKSSVIKSKKDIQDVANAPVKPDER